MLKSKKKLLFFSLIFLFTFCLIIFSNISYCANTTLYRSFTRSTSPNNTTTILNAPPQGMCIAGDKVVFAQEGSAKRLVSSDYSNSSSQIAQVWANTNLGHCNDIAYDPNNGILVVATVKQDGSTKLWAAHYNPDNNNIEDASVTAFTSGINSFSGVTYNTDEKYFIGYSGNSDGETGTFYRFNLRRNTSTKKIEVSESSSSLFTINKKKANGELLTTQGISYLGNRVFMAFSDLNNNNGNNYIRMYTLDSQSSGTKTHVGTQISINASDVGNSYTSSNTDYLTELEATDFDSNGVMLMFFNTHEGTGSTMKLKFYKTSDHKTQYDIPKTLSILSQPNKKTYVQNSENLNLSGGKIRLNYYSGSGDAKYEDIDMTDSRVQITGFSNSSTGTKTLTVSYEGKKATFNVSVIAKSVTSISVASRPTKTTYVQSSENLDLTGGTIKVNYNDNSSQTISMNTSGVLVSGFSNSSTGTKTLTVSYGNKTTTFNVSVIAKSVTSISVASRPTKTTYIQSSENLDLTGGTIKVNYNDNSSQTISMNTSGVLVTGFDNSTTGTKILTVSYDNKTTTFTVSVTPNDIPTDEYEMGDVTEDGRINIRDIITIRKYIASPTKWSLTDAQKTRADVDRNSIINIRDIIRIRKYIAASSNSSVANKHPDWLNL